MNWQDIKVSEDNTHFLFEGNPAFIRRFIEVLKFHSPGFAPVKDESGSFHIDSSGNELYAERYTRTFGFYCNRASVVQADKCFHITDKGIRAYQQSYSWTGNFQENLSPVREGKNYFHIDLDGKRICTANFLYCGDFKDGIACVKASNGFFRHLYLNGNYLHEKKFYDLGVFHKNFATAKDEYGWHHIDRSGNEIYRQRYLAVEPFYNGFALVTMSENKKIIINEQGKTILSV